MLGEIPVPHPETTTQPANSDVEFNGEGDINMSAPLQTRRAQCAIIVMILRNKHARSVSRRSYLHVALVVVASHRRKKIRIRKREISL